MEFIQENYGVIVSAIVMVIAVLLAFVVLPFLKSRGVNISGGSATVAEILKVLRIILKNTDMDSKAKKDAEKILEIAEVSVRYVEQVSKDLSNDEKKAMAMQTTLQALASMGIVVNEDLMQLIEVGIEAAVNLLPKTNA